MTPEELTIGRVVWAVGVKVGPISATVKDAGTNYAGHYIHVLWSNGGGLVYFEKDFKEVYSTEHEAGLAWGKLLKKELKKLNKLKTLCIEKGWYENKRS